MQEEEGVAPTVGVTQHGVPMSGMEGLDIDPPAADLDIRDALRAQLLRRQVPRREHPPAPAVEPADVVADGLPEPGRPVRFRVAREIGVIGRNDRQAAAQRQVLPQAPDHEFRGAVDQVGLNSSMVRAMVRQAGAASRTSG